MMQVDDADSIRCLSLESSLTPTGSSRRSSEERLQEAELETTSSPQQKDQQQHDWAGWGQDDDMVVIQDWDESSLATYRPQTTAAHDQAGGEEPHQPMVTTETTQLPAGMLLREP